MQGRRATDDEVTTWQRDGWVVLHDLVSTDDVDAAVPDLWTTFPKPEKFHDDPARFLPPGKDTKTLRRGWPDMPEHGPWFRPEQHRWGGEFPFMGSGALEPAVRAPLDRRLRGAGAADARHPLLPGARERPLHR